MSQAVLRLILSIIEIFFVINMVNIVKKRQWNIREMLFCTLLYLPGYFFLEENNWRMYMLKNIYQLLVFLIYLVGCKLEIRKNIYLICASLSILEIVKIVISTIGALIVAVISLSDFIEQKIFDLLVIFFMGIFICFVNYIIKNRIKKFELSNSKKFVACFMYVFILCIKIPFLYTDIRDALTLKLVFVTILCCTVIFLIISKIEKHNAEIERAKIEENNKNLSTKLHKSQEIIPAMVQVLSSVTENSGIEMEEHEAQKLLEEVSSLYGQQLKENSKEDLQLKNFCSTGLKILDQQLRVYQMEASDRNVNLDIFVQAPINDLIKKDDIDQLKLQRAVGDLVRNAFRVVESEDEKCRAKGHILLIIGCQYEGILEIAVVDNGKQFPLYVVEAFGNRGVTTGGTGNGLADLVEFAGDAKASIHVDEFDGETSLFTKKVSIVFDKQSVNCFNSPRKTLVENAFWNNK